ncbi:hypothetical protein ACWEJ6_12745 [Nonomuraea sp. NPDC004702]
MLAATVDEYVLSHEFLEVCDIPCLKHSKVAAYDVGVMITAGFD